MALARAPVPVNHCPTVDWKCNPGQNDPPSRGALFPPASQTAACNLTVVIRLPVEVQFNRFVNEAERQ